MWKICHKSGRTLFTTDDERTAMNRAKYGWRVEKVDQNREQFEACYSDKYGTPKNVLEKLRKGDEYTVEEGDRLNRAWDMWKASRKELVIELPNKGFYFIKADACPSDHYNAGVRDVAELLDTAGITVNQS